MCDPKMAIWLLFLYAFRPSKENKMLIVPLNSLNIQYGSWLSLAMKLFFYYKTLTGPLFSGEYEMQDPKSPDEV